MSLVPKNALIVSVERQPGHDGVFLLLFEEAFLEQLTEDDIRAVVAHELGHVWIFTHHPYLQTEQLANQIAMRLVTRESLEPVYDKVRKRIGERSRRSIWRGTLVISPQPTTRAATGGAREEPGRIQDSSRSAIPFVSEPPDAAGTPPDR